MVANAEHPNAGARAMTSLEHAISQSLATMRQLAAESGTDDYWENWTTEVMDRRPLVFVAAVLDGQTLAWLMEPQGGAEHDGVLHTAAYHRRATGSEVASDPGSAECIGKAMPIETILQGVNWLVRDLTGEPLSD
jgi:hypothetical protein